MVDGVGLISLGFPSGFNRATKSFEAFAAGFSPLNLSTFFSTDSPGTEALAAGLLTFDPSACIGLGSEETGPLAAGLLPLDPKPRFFSRLKRSSDRASVNPPTRLEKRRR